MSSGERISSTGRNTYSEIKKKLATYKHDFSVVACNSVGVTADNEKQRRNLILKYLCDTSTCSIFRALIKCVKCSNDKQMDLLVNRLMQLCDV